MPSLRFATVLLSALWFAGALVPPAAEGAPAPWYWWRSKLDGSTHCAQVAPGPGWERARGPFRDGRCERPLVRAG